MSQAPVVQGIVPGELGRRMVAWIRSPRRSLVLPAPASMLEAEKGGGGDAWDVHFRF